MVTVESRLISAHLGSSRLISGQELEMSQLAEHHAAEPPAKRQMLGGGAAGSAADGAASVGYRAMTREEHMAAAEAEAKAAAAAAERAAADAAEAERSAEQQAVFRLCSQLRTSY